MVQHKFLVRNLANVLRKLNLSISGKKAEQIDRLSGYLANCMRLKDQPRINALCNIVISEMNSSFAHERDQILQYAGVPELRYSLPHNGDVYSSAESTPPSSIPAQPAAYGLQTAAVGDATFVVQMNGTRYHYNGQIPNTIVSYEKSPFYNLGRSVSAPIMIPKPSTGGQSKFLVTIHYHFSTKDIPLAKQGKLALLLMSVNYTEAQRNGTTSKPTHIAFPYQTAMSINGKPYTESLRGLKNKPGTTRPADITKYTNKTATNTIEVHVSDPADLFMMRLYLASPISVDDIVKQVMGRSKIKKQDTVNHIKNHGTDDDIEELSIVVNLKCPLAGSRISVPARSVHCKHFECFDLTSFILLQQQATTWRCPICNESIKFEDLAVDEYMQDVLENVKVYDISEVEFLPEDGTWKKPAHAPLLEDDDYDSDAPANQQHPAETQKEKSSFVPDDAVVISLDSDEEDEEPENVAPPSRQVQPSSSPTHAPNQSSNSPNPVSVGHLHQEIPSVTSAPVNNSVPGILHVEPPQQTKDYSREELFEQMPTWGSSLFGHRRPRPNLNVDISSTNNTSNASMRNSANPNSATNTSSEATNAVPSPLTTFQPGLPSDDLSGPSINQVSSNNIHHQDSTTTNDWQQDSPADASHFLLRFSSSSSSNANQHFSKDENENSANSNTSSSGNVNSGSPVSNNENSEPQLEFQSNDDVLSAGKVFRQSVQQLKDKYKSARSDRWDKSDRVINGRGSDGINHSRTNSLPQSTYRDESIRRSSNPDTNSSTQNTNRADYRNMFNQNSANETVPHLPTRNLSFPSTQHSVPPSQSNQQNSYSGQYYNNQQYNQQSGHSGQYNQSSNKGHYNGSNRSNNNRNNHSRRNSLQSDSLHLTLPYPSSSSSYQSNQNSHQNHQHHYNQHLQSQSSNSRNSYQNQYHSSSLPPHNSSSSSSYSNTGGYSAGNLPPSYNNNSSSNMNSNPNSNSKTNTNVTNKANNANTNTSTNSNPPQHGVKRSAAELNEDSGIIDLTLTDDEY